MSNEKVVVVGSSYSSALVYFCLQNFLTKTREPIDLIWLTDKNYYSFNSLLPQYLCDSVSFTDITQELRGVGIIKPGVSYLESKILNIDFSSKTIKTQKGEITYTYLVLAPEVDKDSSDLLFSNERCLMINSLQDVIKLQSIIVKNLEIASGESDPNLRSTPLNYSIIGANNYGIELACSLHDYVYALMKNNYPELNKSLLKINLIDKKNALVEGKNPFFKSSLLYILNKKGIILHTSANVTAITENKIEINNEKEILSGTVLYAGKYKYSSLIKSLPLKLDDSFLACVDIYLKADGFNDVFVIGESVTCLDLSESIPRNILLFKKQAEIASLNILSKINNNPLKSLNLNYQIDFLSLGRKKSLVEIKGLYFSGYFAWLFHRIIYIFAFIGLKKKIRSLAGLLFDIFCLRDNVHVNFLPQTKEKQVVNK